MDPVLGGALLGGAFKLGGGILSSITGNNSQKREYERQKEFAQNGISWRVADAEKAGIHPLVALGTNVTSYTPQSVYSNDYGLTDIGQGLSNFVQNYKTPAERARENYVKRTSDLLTLRRLELENYETQSRIDYNNAQIAAMSIKNQPGNPIGGVTNPFTGGNDSQHGDKSIQFMEFRPGYYGLQPGNDYTQLFEDFPVIGSIPPHLQKYVLSEGFHKGFLPPDRFIKWGYFYDKKNDAFTRIGTPEYNEAIGRFNAEKHRKNVAKSLISNYSIPDRDQLRSRSKMFRSRVH